MELIFETMAGLEDVAAAEVDALVGILPRTRAPGRMVAAVPAAGPMMEALKVGLRCCSRFGVLLADAEVTSLADAQEVAAEIRIERFLGLEHSFGVRYTRQGQHDFNRQDLGRVVGAGIIARFRDRHGARPEVDLDDPDVIVRADLFQNQLLLWVDVVGDQDLSYRAYREYAHMASMRPMVANLLLRLVGWTDTADALRLQLIDPFCGSATILIEAALIAGVGLGRSGHVVHGVERFPGHVLGATANIARAGVAAEVVIHAGLAEATDSMLPERQPGDSRTRVVVTNPPFGRRVASPRQVDAIYRAAAQSWARAGVARIVTLAERSRSMATALADAGFAVRRQSAAIYGQIPVTVFVAER
jgi:tRNA (guanine6-N2)-methyltransferase